MFGNDEGCVNFVEPRLLRGSGSRTFRCSKVVPGGFSYPK